MNIFYGIMIARSAIRPDFIAPLCYCIRKKGKRKGKLMKMLEKVWIVITEEDEKTEEQAKRLKKRLQSEGLEAGTEPFFSDSRKPQPAAGELYLTDCPEAVRRLAGENCRILLYLTEKSRKLSMTEYPYAVEDLEEIDAGYLEGIYRRLAGEPWEILRTKRLLVREQREEDLDSLYEIYAHPDMTAYPWAWSHWRRKGWALMG